MSLSPAIDAPAHLPQATSTVGSSTAQAGKRLLDVAGSAVLLVLLAPVLVACAIAIRLDTAGPVFYRQERVGRGGATFRIWKLRTMVPGADLIAVGRNDADGLLFKLREDPRVTRAGRVLRRWSLDEVPQLLNVLRGQMSLVGPRPLPVDTHLLTAQAHRRQLVRPGLTGLWQVSGRSDVRWSECLSLDLQYVDQWRLALDLRILLRTPAAVMRRTGAY